MVLQRIDRLAEPPVVGLYYLVPAIRWRFRAGWGSDPQEGARLWWPVIGPKHDDIEFFEFPYKHYHSDPRFFTRAHWSRMWDRREGGKMMDAIGAPLNSISLPNGPRAPTLRRMRCTLDVIDYPAARSKPICEINAKFAGHQCDKGKSGWICPHRHVPLGSVKPIDGVITCFLHGMRIDAQTGQCLGPARS